VKRKADDSVVQVAQQKSKISSADQASILAEEDRRRESRNRQSLFLKGVAKGMTHSSLKALHPDIASVRVAGNHAWLVFSSEPACAKAFPKISELKVEGKAVVVDFCGSKSKNAKPTQQDPEHDSKNRPINPLEILVSGIPKTTTKEQLAVVFPNAKTVNMPSRVKNKNQIAFLKFDTEAEARAAFDKGDTMKIGGAMVDVYYSRIPIALKKKAPKAPKQNGNPPSKKAKVESDAPKPSPTKAAKKLQKLKLKKQVAKKPAAAQQESDDSD